MYTVDHVIKALEHLAPTYLAEKWDNVGLLVGSRQQKVKKILCALDINLEVIEEAIKQEVDCIITHHPFIFKSLTRLDFDTPKGKVIWLLIQNNIAVYSMHTNWDIASGGINDILAKELGLEETRSLEDTFTESVYKLAVYTPKEKADEVRDVLITYNSCKIGNYRGCTFMLEGEGSFMPLGGSMPYRGEQNRTEFLEEVKLESIVYLKDVPHLMQKVKEVHPYEEIAYDVYELKNLKLSWGIGRYGKVEPITLEELIKQTKKLFNIPYVRLVGNKNELIHKIALCSGSGSEYIAKASKVADVYITGDVKFHEAQSALEAGLVVIDVGHYASENIAMKFLKQYLEERFSELAVNCSKVNGEVFQTI